MTNINKAKGTAFERIVRAYLAEIFGTWRVRRPHQEGWRDVGDLHVEPSTVIQCKDVARLDVTGWLSDVEKQRTHANARWGVVVWKRRQRSVGNAVVLMTLDTFRQMLTDLQPPAAGGTRGDTATADGNLDDADLDPDHPDEAHLLGDARPPL